MAIINGILKIESDAIENNNFPWETEINRELQYTLMSIGIIIKVYNKYFLICNYHTINYSKNLYLIDEENKTKYSITDKKYIIPEIDLAVIELDEDINDVFDIIEYSDIDEFNINVKDIKDNDIFDFIIPFNDVYMSLQCNIIDFTKNTYNNICFPDMPMFIAKLTDTSIKKINNNFSLLHGASGTPIYKNNKIYGILSGELNNDGTVILTPIFMIKRVINEIITIGTFNGLCK